MCFIVIRTRLIARYQSRSDQRCRDFLSLEAIAEATINFTDISPYEQNGKRTIETSQKGQGAWNFLTFKTCHGKYSTHVQILRFYLSVFRFSTLLPYSRDLSLRSERRICKCEFRRSTVSTIAERDLCDKNKFLLPFEIFIPCDKCVFGKEFIFITAKYIYFLFIDMEIFHFPFYR